MPRSNSSWKANERQWAEILKAYGLSAKRKTRAGNFSVSTDDVDIAELPWTINDTKYSIRGWKQNRLLEEVSAKYCKEKPDTPILITKGFKEVGQCATVDAEFLAMLLTHWVKSPEGTSDLFEVYLKRKKK